MRVIDWQKATVSERKEALARPQHSDDAALTEKVAAILQQVKAQGDTALRELTAKFDGSAPAESRVDTYSIDDALRNVSPKLGTAIKQAKANIQKFHAAEAPKPISVETMPGVTCALEWRAIERVGIYIPGGTAPLFSTLLMLAIPAKIAGCKRLVLCTPPKNGVIHPAILAAAQICGVDEIYAVGGAQAIGAMAFGTESIPKVDKICGPGNAFVTKAKQLVSQDPQGAAIDMPAGPSEVLVIADATARAAWVAADLLAQAEHDTNAQAIFVTTDAMMAERVQDEVARQLELLSRKEIATQSITESRIIVVPDMATAIDVSNQYAPEHLIIHNEDAAKYLPQVQNAGSVFMGATTPESAGDYASGTNHVLPTYGYARAYSGINVLSFMKSMSVQSITSAGLKNIGGTIIAMAEAEGLDAHAAAVKVRLGV